MKTKWPPYVFPCIPLCIVIIGLGFRELIRVIGNRKVALTILTCIFVAFAINPVEILNAHSPSDKQRLARIHNTAIYRALPSHLPANIKLVLNTKSFEDLDAMFYNKNITFYSWMLNDRAIDSLQKYQIPFAVFKEHGLYRVPQDVVSDHSVFIIDRYLK